MGKLNRPLSSWLLGPNQLANISGSAVLVSEANIYRQMLQQGCDCFRDYTCEAVVPGGPGGAAVTFTCNMFGTLASLPREVLAPGSGPGTLAPSAQAAMGSVSWTTSFEVRLRVHPLVAGRIAHVCARECAEVWV